MKKTYVTSMPNNIGAFLKASECFSALGINMIRVSYNKAIDSHTLFIDVKGTEEQGLSPYRTLTASVSLLSFSVLPWEKTSRLASDN